MCPKHLVSPVLTLPTAKREFSASQIVISIRTILFQFPFQFRSAQSTNWATWITTNFWLTSLAAGHPPFPLMVSDFTTDLEPYFVAKCSETTLSALQDKRQSSVHHWSEIPHGLPQNGLQPMCILLLFIDFICIQGIQEAPEEYHESTYS